MSIPRRLLAVSIGFVLTMPCYAGFERAESIDFEHFLEFEDDGVLPSAEGLADGWLEDAVWNIDGDTPPMLSVADGLLRFQSVPAGQQSITMWGGSAWETEVTPETSYTMEVRVRVLAAGGAQPGVVLWLANGQRRLILRVGVDGLFTWGGEQLDAGDNSTDFVTIRVAYHAASATYWVWRNDVLVGNRVPDSGAAAQGRTAVFLIDCCTSVEVEGELDWVRWDATEAFAPPADPDDETAPPAPTGLAAVGEDGRVLLDWDDNTDDEFVCYALYRSEDAGGPFDLVDDALFTSEAIDTDVANGTTYHYVVRAVDANDNESDESNEANATPSSGVDVTAPEMPVGLIATSRGGAIFLDWNDNLEGDLAGYIVSRSEVAGGPYAVLADDVTISEFEDDAVAAQTRYYYIVAAYDDADNASDPTPEVSSIVTIGIDDEIEKEAEDFPHKLLFDVDGLLPTEEGADDGWTMEAFNIGEGAAPPSVDVVDGHLAFETVLAGQWSLTNNGGAWTAEIDPTVSYTFEVAIRVTAASGGVPGAVMWLANGQERLVLVIGTDSVSTWSGTQLHEGDNSTEFVSFRIAYDAASGLYFVWRDGALIGTEIPADAADGRTALFLLDCCSTVQAAGEVDYVCWDASGAYWPPVDEGDVTAPDAPTGLAAVAEESRVTLSWEENSEPDLGSYQVGRSEDSGGPYEIIAETGATSYDDEAVVNGTTYFYVVYAVDVNRNVSDPSDEVEATPEEGVDLTAPAAPTGLRAVVTQFAEVALSWNLGPEFDLDTYNVYRSETAGGPYDIIAEALSFFEASYTDDAVDLGTTYYYVVTAVDVSGNESEYSAEESATPEEFEGFPERDAMTFAHKLLFEDDGVLPSVEGADDGWAEDAAWNIGGDVAPSLDVVDGLLQFESVLPGQQSIKLEAGSAWAAEVDPETSYTFEVGLRMIATDAPNPGASLWFANGGTRLILRVDLNGLYTWSGQQLSDEDNTADFVALRVAYDAARGVYFVWRNEVLVGDALPEDAAAAGGRTAVFLIDCCTSVQAQGEFDYVCWDATGAYAPGDGGEERPQFRRGDADASGLLQLNDAIFVFNFLFLGGPDTTCQEAADADNNNRVELTDGIRVLNFLFTGGPPPVDPGPTDCGTDSDAPGSPGDLGCVEYEACP